MINNNKSDKKHKNYYNITIDVNDFIPVSDSKCRITVMMNVIEIVDFNCQ